MTADYIIAGAGSAGCVLAERLTRNPDIKVILLEAGGTDRRFWVETPLGYGRLFTDPDVNWMYRTAPDPGLGGRTDFWPRGKLLGGSSSINAMVYIRGQAADYDDWAAAGNSGWSWRDVAPYFTAIEQGTPDMPDIALETSDVSSLCHPLARRFLDAGTALNIPQNSDFNAGDQEGVGYYRLTRTSTGKRMSSARAFLRPAKHRANLQIVTNALVDKVTFSAGRAEQIHYVRDDETRQVRAARGIILSAGALGSPLILMRSGIGAGPILRDNGIEVVRENAHVGAHMQDHLGVNLIYSTRVPTLNQVLGPLWRRYLAGLQYLAFGTGPLSLSVNQTGGFVRSSPEHSRPNIQLYFQALTTIQARHATSPRLKPDNFPGMALGLSSCRPKSCGHIALQSGAADAPPVIHPNSFSDSADIAELVEGVKLLRQFAAAPALADVIETERLPGPACQTDAELAQDLRDRATTTFHPCGTCRMAPTAATGVVSPGLAVHGIDRLFVADAAIFPNITSGNINAPSMMVGAKAAAIIPRDTGG